MSPNPEQVSDEVQKAANLLARLLAREDTLGIAGIGERRQWRSLTGAQRTQARELAREADELRQRMRDNPELPAYYLPGEAAVSARLDPLIEVHVGFGEKNPETELYEAYRTVHLAFDPALSIQGIEAFARAKNYGSPNTPEQMVGEVFDITVLPFNMYED